MAGCLRRSGVWEAEVAAIERRSAPSNGRRPYPLADASDMALVASPPPFALPALPVVPALPYPLALPVVPALPYPLALPVVPALLSPPALPAIPALPPPPAPCKHWPHNGGSSRCSGHVAQGLPIASRLLSQLFVRGPEPPNPSRLIGCT